MAYIDEVEVPKSNKSDKVNEKVYYSTLTKATKPGEMGESSQSLDEVTKNLKPLCINLPHYLVNL